MSHPRLILASQSPQRRDLLATLEIEFEVIPAHINEQTIKAANSKLRAQEIARAKAKKVSQDNPDAVVVAADIFGVVGKQVMEKPASKAEAKQMLSQLSDKWAIAYTGFCYLDPANDLDYATTVVTKMKFRKLLDQEIERYVAAQPVTTWSAAFCPAYVEGAALTEAINGSFTSFTHGLPVEELVPLLEKSGFYDQSVINR